ncbi:hypothetical protein AB0C04_06955 [Micromonospora sp. NPDC048909]|uniref:hypothetical protein n=1 Tax=Micromonospora sp. NPDC048909 TaxID=3155643 RepID=UPI0033E8B9FF
MSSYRDPAPRGDVYPSEEEIDPTGTAVQPASGPAGAYPDASSPGPRPTPAPPPAPRPVPTPAPPPRAAGPGGRSIVTRHLDGSVEVVTDLDGDGLADVVQVDLTGDGVPDVTYVDRDRDGRLDTVLRDPGPAR